MMCGVTSSQPFTPALSQHVRRRSFGAAALATGLAIVLLFALHSANPSLRFGLFGGSMLVALGFLSVSIYSHIKGKEESHILATQIALASFMALSALALMIFNQFVLHGPWQGTLCVVVIEVFALPYLIAGLVESRDRSLFARHQRLLTLLQDMQTHRDEAIVADFLYALKIQRGEREIRSHHPETASVILTLSPEEWQETVRVIVTDEHLTCMECVDHFLTGASVEEWESLFEHHGYFVTGESAVKFLERAALRPYATDELIRHLTTRAAAHWEKASKPIQERVRELIRVYAFSTTAYNNTQAPLFLSLLHEYLDKHQEELSSSLKEVIHMISVYSATVLVKKEALSFTEKLLERYVSLIEKAAEKDPNFFITLTKHFSLPDLLVKLAQAKKSDALHAALARWVSLPNT